MTPENSFEIQAMKQLPKDVNEQLVPFEWDTLSMDGIIRGLTVTTKMSLRLDILFSKRNKYSFN